MMDSKYCWDILSIITGIKSLKTGEISIEIDGGSVNYEKDCMCNAMYSACI